MYTYSLTWRSNATATADIARLELRWYDREDIFFRLRLTEIHDEVRRVVVLGALVTQLLEVIHDVIHPALVEDAALFHIDTPKPTFQG
jgi:hypothetical protein